MDNEQLNNDFEEQFNEQLDNLPEEKPSVKDWELLRDSLKKEGLIKPDSRWRKYLLFFLLPAVIGGAISIPLLTNRYGIDVNFISTDRNTVAQNKILMNDLQENGTTNASVNVTPKSNEILQQLTRTHANQSVNEHSRPVKPKMEAFEKINPVKNNQGGVTKSSREGDLVSDSRFDATKENTVSTTTQTENDSAQSTLSDSAVSSITPFVENSADTTLADSAATKDSLVKKSGNKARPWIGVYASWDFTSYHLRENSNVLVNEASTVFNSSGIGGEKSLAQYTLGIMGGLRVSKKFALEAGVFYSQKKKLSDIISSPAGADAQGNESFSDFTYNYNAKYIEAQGRIKYYFLEKKHSYYAGIGAAGSFNFPSSKKDKGYFERTTFSETAAPQTDIVTLESSSAGLSIIFSAGAEVSLSPRWNLFVEPAYKHALTSVTRHPYYDKIPVEHFWRTFSLGTGLMYKF